MEQLTKNQAGATSQEAVQNQNDLQLRYENAHNDKSVHGGLNPTYQAGLRRYAVQPDIEAERKKRDEIEDGKIYCIRRFGGATCDDKSAQIFFFNDTATTEIYPLSLHDALPISYSRKLLDSSDWVQLIAPPKPFHVLPYGYAASPADAQRSEEHTSELQSHLNLVCRLLLEKKKLTKNFHETTSESPHHQTNTRQN